MANLRTVKEDAIFSKSQKSRKHSFDIKLLKKNRTAHVWANE